MKKTLLISALAALSVAAMAQTPPSSGRVFTYLGNNGSGIGAWYVDDTTVNAYGTNSADAYHASFSANTTVYVKTFVWVGGSFDGAYNVNGFGAGSEAANAFDTNTVQVRTNRSLTATPYSFSAIRDASNVKYADIDYKLYFVQAGFTLNSLEQIGQDAYWKNGNTGSQQAVLNLQYAYSDYKDVLRPDAGGAFALVLGRRIYNLSSYAQGNSTLHATGLITITPF